jgi:hypothetical protein
MPAIGGGGILLLLFIPGIDGGLGGAKITNKMLQINLKF